MWYVGFIKCMISHIPIAILIKSHQFRLEIHLRAPIHTIGFIPFDSIFLCSKFFELLLSPNYFITVSGADFIPFPNDCDIQWRGQEHGSGKRGLKCRINHKCSSSIFFDSILLVFQPVHIPENFLTAYCAIESSERARFAKSDQQTIASLLYSHNQITQIPSVAFCCLSFFSCFRLFQLLLLYSLY